MPWRRASLHPKETLFFAYDEAEGGKKINFGIERRVRLVGIRWGKMGEKRNFHFIRAI